MEVPFDVLRANGIKIAWAATQGRPYIGEDPLTLALSLRWRGDIVRRARTGCSKRLANAAAGSEDPEAYWEVR